MPLRAVLLSVFVIFGSAVSGCLGTVDLVKFEDPTAEPREIRESPDVPAEHEGLLLAQESGTPLYTFRRDFQTDPAGETWLFDVDNADRPLTVVVEGMGREVMASRQFTPIEGPEWWRSTVSIAVAVPGDFPATGFRMLGTVEAEGTVPRLRAVRRLVAGETGGILVDDGRLTLGLSSEVRAWEFPGGDGFLWDMEIKPVEGSGAGSVIIDYSYDPGTAAGRLAGQAAPMVDLDFNEQRLSISVRPGTNSVAVYRQSHPDDGAHVTVRSDVDGFTLTGVGFQRIEPGVNGRRPLFADLGAIYSFKPYAWRQPDFEIFRWTLFPDVLVMDTRNYDVQARFFKRLAFFVEKEGFRGRLLNDAELAGRHGYNAHNYSAEGLAEFFSAAREQTFVLGPEEELLRSMLLEAGIIVDDGSRILPGSGGILSISQASWGTPGLRQLLLTHEAFHGVYYASPEYVRAIGDLWDSLSEDERQFWLLLLDGMQYDVTDPYLVRNEFHAYLLQQRLPEVSWYFEERSADRLSRWKPSHAPWISTFIRNNRGTFASQAQRADEILFSVSGLVAGDVFCLVSR